MPRGWKTSSSSSSTRLFLSHRAITVSHNVQALLDYEFKLQQKTEDTLRFNGLSSSEKQKQEDAQPDTYLVNFLLAEHMSLPQALSRLALAPVLWNGRESVTTSRRGLMSSRSGSDMWPTTPPRFSLPFPFRQQSRAAARRLRCHVHHLLYRIPVLHPTATTPSLPLTPRHNTAAQQQTQPHFACKPQLPSSHLAPPPPPQHFAPP